MFRHQSDFLSAPQSVSRVFVETDWGAIFQWKFNPRNMRNAHGSGANSCSHAQSTPRLSAASLQCWPASAPPRAHRHPVALHQFTTAVRYTIVVSYYSCTVLSVSNCRPTARLSHSNTQRVELEDVRRISSFVLSPVHPFHSFFLSC